MSDNTETEKSEWDNRELGALGSMLKMVVTKSILLVRSKEKSNHLQE